MTICSSCAKSVHPYQEMQEDMTMRDRCPDCHSLMAAEAPPPIVYSAPTASGLARRSTPTASTSPADLVEMAQRQIDDIDLELARLGGLKARRRVLARLVRAGRGRGRAAPIARTNTHGAFVADYPATVIKEHRPS